MNFVLLLLYAVFWSLFIRNIGMTTLYTEYVKFLSLDFCLYYNGIRFKVECRA